MHSADTTDTALLSQLEFRAVPYIPELADQYWLNMYGVHLMLCELSRRLRGGSTSIQRSPEQRLPCQQPGPPDLTLG